jgi:RNA polymerase sigma-70 factor (sigma-E family)
VDEEFGDFVAARGASLCRTAFLLTGDWQAGEDLVQEALARTFLRRRRLRDGAALEPYTRKVMLSLFLTARRRRWHQELPHAELPAREAVSGLDDIAERDWLWRALGQLSGQQRAVLVLRYFEDLAEADIAVALDCSAGTVKAHAARGLERLRKVISVSEESSR